MPFGVVACNFEPGEISTSTSNANENWVNIYLEIDTKKLQEVVRSSNFYRGMFHSITQVN